jgi:hypothetical protein
MPVPIVTENHDGLKLRTTLLQPTSYFDVDTVISLSAGEDFPSSAESPVVMADRPSPAGSDLDVTLLARLWAVAVVLLRRRRPAEKSERVAICAGATIVIAGLLDAMRCIMVSSSSARCAIVAKVEVEGFFEEAMTSEVIVVGAF